MTIIAQFFDADGRALGWQPWDAIKAAASTVGHVVASGSTSAASAIASGASATAGAVATGARTVANAVVDAAQWTCDHVMTNGSVQTGAAIAAKLGKYIPPNPVVPGQIAAGVGYGVQAAGALCNLAWPPTATGPTPTLPPAVQALTNNTAVFTQPQLHAIRKPPAPRYAPGTIQWQDRKGLWRLAQPRRQGLGAVPAVAYPEVAMSTHPYLTAMSAGALGGDTPYAITTMVTPAANVPIVTQREGEKLTNTTPIYKRPWFWLVVGGVTTAGAVGATVAYRKHSR